MSARSVVLVSVFVVFVVGAFAIIAMNRPAVRRSTNPVFEDGGSYGAATATQNGGSSASFTLSQVAAHATERDCWSAIGDSVYDLTSWVSRHPGGSRSILNLCGKNGTDMFTRKHGGSARAAQALFLLRIGVLTR